MALLVVSFALCLFAFTAIGALAARKAQGSTGDYLLAGRSVSPWLTALSSVATNNSGFMFIGLIGFAYTSGVRAVWLQGSWILGDLLAWAFVHGRVRTLSGDLTALSVPAFLGTVRGSAGVGQAAPGEIGRAHV